MIDWKPSNVEGLVNAYQDFLLVRYPKHLKKFENLLADDPEAAKAEAVVFSIVRSMQLNPELTDKPGIGGTDFLCRPEHRDPFVLEVTTLGAETVERQTCLPQKAEEDTGGAFRMIPHVFKRKVCAKIGQLADNPCARVLALATFHELAYAPFGVRGAELLLTSEPRLRVPIEQLDAPIIQTTDLEHAIFVKLDTSVDPPRIIADRRGVSAILLLTIGDESTSGVGILHQDPLYPLDIRNFSSTPFARLKWPIHEGRIGTEWVIAHPNSDDFPHIKVQLKDKELKVK